MARGTRRRLPKRPRTARRLPKTARRISRTVVRTPARTVKPNQVTKTSSVRRTGQRFPPQAKKQRQKTRALSSRISRVNKLSRTRSVDVRRVGSSGFKIFAPRNTKPAFTVGGKQFVQNPDTRPTNLNQLQIKQEQVRQVRKGITPRQIIDRNVDRAKGFAFNVGTEIFKGGTAVGGVIFDAGVSTRRGIEEAKAANVKRKQELKAQGKLPSQQPRGEPLVTGEKIQQAGSGIAKFLGGGLLETGFVVVAGASGLGALDRIFRTGEGIQKQQQRKEAQKQEVLGKGANVNVGRGGLFGIGDLTPFESKNLRDPFASVGGAGLPQNLPPAIFSGTTTTGNRPDENKGDIFEPDRQGGSFNLPNAEVIQSGARGSNKRKSGSLGF